MNSEFKKCCFTGYRPAKFPFLISKNDPQYIKMENNLTETLFTLAEDGCFTYYCGMAMGFDIIAAESVLLMKKAIKTASIKLICVVPFKTQSEGFNSLWKSRYDNIISNADEVVLLSDSYFSGCYSKRNKFMVDRSDYVLTWFDGKSGGTKNTIEYAKSKGKSVINLNCEESCR